MVLAKKSLGQHWLTDQKTLAAICKAAELTGQDVVLEIGPGQGSLTKHLLERAKKVIAVELDPNLARELAQKQLPNLEVVRADILKFDLTKLPASYKVVANIPYYLTSNLLRTLSESPNPPVMMVLLVQKEVAQRIAAQPGQMSLLSVSVQLYYQPELGIMVPAKLFDPQPKVDSQVVILRRHQQPLFKDVDTKAFFRLVKAGFTERRKKLRSSLAGGLGLSKAEVDQLLTKAGLNPDARAQELSLEQWHNLHKQIER